MVAIARILQMGRVLHLMEELMPPLSDPNHSMLMLSPQGWLLQLQSLPWVKRNVSPLLMIYFFNFNTESLSSWYLIVEIQTLIPEALGPSAQKRRNSVSWTLLKVSMRTCKSFVRWPKVMVIVVTVIMVTKMYVKIIKKSRIFLRGYINEGFDGRMWAHTSYLSQPSQPLVV